MVCQLYQVTRHVASTFVRSMTNGANYKRGKLHHSPWHSDIHNSNQRNTPPGWLSCLFRTKTVNKREEEPINHCESPRNERAGSNYFPTAFPWPVPIPILIPSPRPFPRPLPSAIPRPFPRPFPTPLLIIAIAPHCFEKAGFGSGFVKKSASISAVGT